MGAAADDDRTDRPYHGSKKQVVARGFRSGRPAVESHGGVTQERCCGPVAEARVLRCHPLLLARQVGGMRLDAKRVKELEIGNTRFKKLLTGLLLKNELTREVLRKQW
jgi:hypothetical protein